MQKLKINSKIGKLLLSLLIGLMMNPLWQIVIFLITFESEIAAASDGKSPTPLLEQFPFAYLYYWLDMFLPGSTYEFKAAMSLILISNTLLYFGLSYVFLSFFKSDKNNGKRLLSVLIGILINPFLIFGVFMIDSSALSGDLFPLSIFHQNPFGYLFCWSLVFLHWNPIDLRAATMLPLILNPILYFGVSYGFFSLFERKKNKLA